MNAGFLILPPIVICPAQVIQLSLLVLHIMVTFKE